MCSVQKNGPTVNTGVIVGHKMIRFGEMNWSREQ